MRFSASSVAASLEAISSWSAHNSSVDIDLKPLRFTTVPNHGSTKFSSLVKNMSRIRPIWHLFKHLFQAVKLQEGDLFGL